MKPAKSKRIRWYTDPTFRRLVHDAPDVPLLDVQITADNGSILLPAVPTYPSASPAKSPQASTGQKGASPDPDESQRIAERLGRQLSSASAAQPSTPGNREVASAPEGPFDAESQSHSALAQAQSTQPWRAKSDLEYWASQVVEGWAAFDDVLSFAFQRRLARAEGAGSQEIDHDLIAKKAMDDVVHAMDNYERHRKRSC
jgi:hypothetical protein